MQDIAAEFKKVKSDVVDDEEIVKEKYNSVKEQLKDVKKEAIREVREIFKDVKQDMKESMGINEEERVVKKAESNKSNEVKDRTSKIIGK